MPSSTGPTPVVVIDVVALTGGLLQHAPRLAQLGQRGAQMRLDPILPAVTSTVQSSLLTGLLPREHGIVGNGWYFRDLAQVWLWRQSNHLVSGEKVWERARRRHPGLRCAKLFWWFNMYSSADYSVTPRPAYLADGRKKPDLYTQPAELRTWLQSELGPFPLFEFWGPKAGIGSSCWIALSAQHVFDRFRPDLSLVYLPHLDYDLQRLGPDHPSIPEHVAAIDELASDLAEHCLQQGARVLVVSEYGIERVDRMIPINRILRQAGWLRVSDSLGGELLDAGASRAFAVADHQLAHVYVAQAADLPAVRRDLEAAIPGVALYDRAEQAAIGLDHPRSGELVAIAPAGSWLGYPYWLDDRNAPDFARTVDIHRKPGYDPAELTIDPRIRLPMLSVGWKLLRNALGLRTVFDLIPLDASHIRGSHGRLPERDEDAPVLLCSEPIGAGRLPVTGVASVIESLLFDSAPLARPGAHD